MASGFIEGSVMRLPDPDHDGEDGGGSEGEPAGVGADVAGLDAADEGAEAEGAGGGSGAEAVDEELVEEAEEDAGGDLKGLDDGGVVELVDVELVVDEGVDGAEALGEGGGSAGFAVVELPG